MHMLHPENDFFGSSIMQYDNEIFQNERKSTVPDQLQCLFQISLHKQQL